MAEAEYPPVGPVPQPADSWSGWWLASDGNWYPPQAAPGGWGPAPHGWGPAPGGWGPAMSPSDERTWAMLAHLSHFFGSWIVQLVILCTKGKESSFVRDQTVEALNFSITFTIAVLVSLVLCLVLIGFVLLAAVFVVGVIFPILGAISVNRGEAYRYPICLRLVH